MKKNLVVVLLCGALAVLWCSSLFAQWLPDKRLSFNDKISNTSYNNTRCVAVQGNTVHVVWADERDRRVGDQNTEIYYKRSTDYGVTWEPETRLTFDIANAHFPSVAVSGQFVHVIWTDDRNLPPQFPRGIYYKRSSDGGVSWGPDVWLLDGGYADAPHSLAVSGSSVHLVWQPGGALQEIYARRSTDNGTTWGPDNRLSFNPSSSWGPSVAVSPQGNVLAVWHDNRNYWSWEIYYNRSTDNGATWGTTDFALTRYDSSFSVNPSIAIQDTNVYVVWGDYRDGNHATPQVYFKRSTDYGVTWGSDTRLTYASGNSWFPSVAASGSAVHVVWPDLRDGPNGEIYYKVSTDFGVSWDADTRLTENAAYSDLASVVASGKVASVVWTDNRDGNNEIYFKQGGAFPGLLTEPSQGRHMVRDPATGTIHLVMHTDEATPRVYYTKTTDGGVHWDSISILGNGQYPTIGLAMTGPDYVVIGVAYKRIVAGGGYKLSYRWLDPFGVWHASVDISTSSNPGPPSLVMSNGWAYVAYKSGAAVLCSRFDCTNPAGFLTEAIDATSGPTQPCLAVDGNGAVYAAWRRTTGSYANQIWYCPRGTSSPYWNPTNKLRVDQTADPSQQPFVECYGDSVFVAWSDGQPSPSDVWRAAKSFSDIQWQYTNVSLIPGGSPASESPTQAWREFTTWSEWSPGLQPDIYYWRPSGLRDVVESNPAEWSYWTHSQMQYPDPGFSTDLWSAWTESPNPNAPPYRVMTKHQSFLFFGPGLGSEMSDYGSYYKVLAGQDSASQYCRKRDGVIRFADKAVDFARDSLVYELPYLDPVYDYYVRVASYREAGSDWVQGLSVNGGPTRTVRFAPNLVDTAWVRIPPEAYERDRKVSFSLKNLRGDYVTGLSLTLFQRDPKRGKGGGQAGEIVVLPAKEIFAVYPNPMNSKAQIAYSLKAPGKVNLSVYDVSGRLIRRVVAGIQMAGVHTVSWDGKDTNGRLAGSGVYFIRLNTLERTKTARLVVVR